MTIKNTVGFLMLFVALTSFSQEKFYTSFSIPNHLKQNANAVIRSNVVSIELKSSSDMKVTKKMIVTILNKEGHKSVDAYVYYDENVKIRDLEVLIFNNSGKEIKKIKKNDFKDVSAVDGGTLYSDSRVKYLEYTPIAYPYTMEFTSVVTTSNTAFIQSFMPISNYFVSVENSSYEIIHPETITIRKKEKNFGNISMVKEEDEKKIFYRVKDMMAMKPEDYSPSFRNLAPVVFFASSEFNYEGVMSKADDWKSMGEWFNDNLLKGRTNLPETTKQHITGLVKGIQEPIEKAKIVYQFVQDNTRYISVQVGVGGMQPIAAEDVDEVKYGDCKGLTNYTKALLDVVGVKSNYTRLYASSFERIDVDKEFVSFSGQTNHVILNIPLENKPDIWLECTSQKLPFGFIGDFTDDRDVMVITPEGGEIKHTKKYTTEENTQIIKGQYIVSNTGGLDVLFSVSSKGIQYDNKYLLEAETQRDLDVHYKKRWSYINNIMIDKMELRNDRDSVVFHESLGFHVDNYSKVIGNRMLLNVNALNRLTSIPDRHRDRKLPIKVNRGFKDVDEVEIKLPTSYKVEALPENEFIETKFGSYKTEIVTKDKNTLIYKRQFIINDGEFPKEDYAAFRDFYKEVSKQDNSKIALIKI